MSTRKISDTCGKKVNARCVDYEGEVNEDSSLENNNCHTVHDTTEDIFEQLEDLNKCLNLDALGELCITYTQADTAKLKINEAILGLEKAICHLQNELLIDETTDCHPIFETDITCLDLDLACLPNAPCEEDLTTLKQLIQAIITQACVTTEIGADYLKSIATDTPAAETATVYIVDTTGGNVTVTLPASPSIGKTWNIKKVSAANTMIIATAGAQTIDGAVSQSITVLNVSVTVVFDGTNYHII